MPENQCGRGPDQNDRIHYTVRKLRPRVGKPYWMSHNMLMTKLGLEPGPPASQAPELCLHLPCSLVMVCGMSP